MIIKATIGKKISLLSSKREHISICSRGKETPSCILRQFPGNLSANFAKTKSQHKTAVDQVTVFILKKEVTRCFVYLMAIYASMPNTMSKTKPKIIFSESGLLGFKKNLDLKGVESVEERWC